MLACAASCLGAAVSFLAFGRAAIAILLGLALPLLLWRFFVLGGGRALLAQARRTLGLSLIVLFYWWGVTAALSVTPARALPIWSRSLVFVLLAAALAHVLAVEPHLRRIALRSLALGFALAAAAVLVLLYGFDHRVDPTLKAHYSAVACLAPVLLLLGTAAAG